MSSYKQMHTDYYISLCPGLFYAANRRVPWLIRDRNSLPQWEVEIQDQHASTWLLYYMTKERGKRMRYPLRPCEGYIRHSQGMSFHTLMLSEWPHLTMLEMGNLEGAFLRSDSHCRLSRTDTMNNELSVAVWYRLTVCPWMWGTGNGPEGWSQSFVCVKQVLGPWAVPESLSRARILVNCHVGLELVLPLPRLLRQLECRLA